MRNIAIYAILLLVTIHSATAIWDEGTGTLEAGEKDIINLPGNIIIRVLEVGDIEGSALIQVDREGVPLGSGIVTKQKPLQIDNVVLVAFEGIANVAWGSSVARLRAYQWIDGELAYTHFPKIMNINTLYDASAIVKNTGSRDARFTIELAQAGTYVRSADKYRDEEGVLHPRILDISRPYRDASIAQGAKQKILYESVAPMRRQLPSVDSLERGGDVVFNLYYKDQLVDQVTIENVQLTNAQTGYIQDLSMESVFSRDSPQEIEIEVLNGGTAYGGIERSKFNVRLETKNFFFLESNSPYKTAELQISQDTLRGDLPAFLTKTWKASLFTLAPPGDYDLVFVLELSGSELDRFTLPVRVLSGANTRITALELPEQVDMGEQFPVKVKVKNTGLGRTVVVKLEGEMIESSISTQVSMGIDEEKELTFMLPATGVGIERIDAKVYLPYIGEKTKNFDPYTQGGYEVHSKAASTYVYVPGSVEPQKEEIRTEPAAEAREPTAAVDFTPSEEMKAEVTPQWNLQQGMPILVVALVILVILIVMKVLFYYAE